MLRILFLLLLTPIVCWAETPTRPRGEFLQMWDAIMSGSMMGPGDGWFKPSLTRYTWERVAKNFDRDRDGRITAKELDTKPELFAVLDRDGDGAITPDDFDWSDNSVYARQMSMATQLLRRADATGDRKVSKEEWDKLFEQVAKGKELLDADDLRKMLFPPAPPRPKGKSGGGMPSRDVLLWGLLTGEVGSGAEGPKLEAEAPDFTLSDPTKKITLTLSDYRDKRPVVLIFGSFT
jgi:hypothetical protein